MATLRVSKPKNTIVIRSVTLQLGVQVLNLMIGQLSNFIVDTILNKLYFILRNSIKLIILIYHLY